MELHFHQRINRVLIVKATVCVVAKVATFCIPS